MSSADITGIHTVGVPVADQDKALAFYTGTLGLSTRMDVPMGNGATRSGIMVFIHICTTVRAIPE